MSRRKESRDRPDQITADRKGEIILLDINLEMFTGRDPAKARRLR